MFLKITPAAHFLDVCQSAPSTWPSLIVAAEATDANAVSETAPINFVNEFIYSPRFKTNRKLYNLQTT
jgi:hypothetical protein